MLKIKKLSTKVLVIALTLILFVLVGCKPLSYLYKEITQYGYIAYPTPLQYAGPGTLIGGSPKSLSLIASPDTCFPEVLNGVPTNLRRIDETTLPKRSYKFSVSGNAKIGLINFLNTGNPVLNVGVNFSAIKTMDLTMSGVKIEYMDSIKLSEYYPKMPEICKQYLNYVGFIIQAIRVEQLSFQFRDASNGLIQFSMDNIEQILDISAGVNYSVDNTTTLNITTPKYIGYQLGQLRLNNNGLVLYRAHKVNVLGKYVFESINIFKDKNKGNNSTTVAKSNEIALNDDSNELENNQSGDLDMAVVNNNLDSLIPGELKELVESDLIKNNAVYTKKKK
ncbi:MAG: hypothetical protein HQK51_06485 [Oligoflexia bacterium]|nr:hypothetical protein [Oligoflexia bacterium]